MLDLSKCVCGSTEVEARIEKGSLVYGKCSFCRSLRQINEINFDSIIKQYEDEIPIRSSPGFERGLYRFAEELLDDLDSFEFKSVLDVGCACGVFLDYVKRKKKVELYGIDINEKAIEVAKQKGLNSVYVGNFLEIALERFDLIVMHDVLEHLVEPKKYLLRARSLCKILQITTPCLDFIDDVKNWEMLRRDHLWIFSLEGLIQLLRGCGFVIEKVKKTKNSYSECLEVICK